MTDLNLEELQDAFNLLRHDEKRRFILQLLIDGDIDYTELSNLYVTSLEIERESAKDKLLASTTWLALAWRSIRNVSNRASAARAIVDSRVMNGTPVYDRCIEFLEGKNDS